MIGQGNQVRSELRLRSYEVERLSAAVEEKDGLIRQLRLEVASHAEREGVGPESEGLVASNAESEGA